MKFICTYCMTFVYDPEKGEIRAGIAPGTAPEALPEIYKCPVCGRPRSFLHPIDEQGFLRKKAQYDKLYPAQ